MNPTERNNYLEQKKIKKKVFGLFMTTNGSKIINFQPTFFLDGSQNVYKL